MAFCSPSVAAKTQVKYFFKKSFLPFGFSNAVVHTKENRSKERKELQNTASFKQFSLRLSLSLPSFFSLLFFRNKHKPMSLLLFPFQKPLCSCPHQKLTHFSASLPTPMSSNLQPFYFLIIIFFFFPSCTLSQAPSPAADACNGIFLFYTFHHRTRIHPYLSDPSLQPYSFRSTATIFNSGAQELKSWNLFIGFKHQEIVVSANPAVLSDGSSLPASVGSATFFSGFPNTDLKTAIEKAGDLAQFQMEIELVGTRFGVLPPGVPMPANISFAHDGENCPSPALERIVLSLFDCWFNGSFFWFGCNLLRIMVLIKKIVSFVVFGLWVSWCYFSLVQVIFYWNSL